MDLLLLSFTAKFYDHDQVHIHRNKNFKILIFLIVSPVCLDAWQYGSLFKEFYANSGMTVYRSVNNVYDVFIVINIIGCPGLRVMYGTK